MKLTIFDIENWREIGATLARNKTRTLMTAFGIFWGTAMLAMLWGGAQGFRRISNGPSAGEEHAVEADVSGGVVVDVVLAADFRGVVGTEA